MRQCNELRAKNFLTWYDYISIAHEVPSSVKGVFDCLVSNVHLFGHL